VNDIAKALWLSVLENDTLLPVTTEEREGVRARVKDLKERLMTWQASDGQVEMPSIGEVCALAADLAKINVRSTFGDLAEGREPRESLPMTGLSDGEPS
jgi:hypothetical protein